MMSERETEIKLGVADAATALALLEPHAATIHMARHFEDNFVLDADDLRLRADGCLLRVRVVDSRATLTFKGPLRISDGVRDREELECEVQHAGNLRRIFERLGYHKVFRYQKYRTVYEVPGFRLHVCLDETPIGVFFELEGAIQDIHSFAEKLGYSRDQYITQSYGGLYFEWCSRNRVTPGEMIFP